jgi:hypothetical protein
MMGHQCEGQNGTREGHRLLDDGTIGAIMLAKEVGDNRTKIRVHCDGGFFLF